MTDTDSNSEAGHHDDGFGRGPKWDLFRYFLAVAKSSSVNGAAQMLRESAPTVSRRLRELERHFSASLFNRGPGKLTLTPAGEDLMGRLSQIDRDMRTITDDLADVRDTLKGRVTITTPRGFGKAVLFQCLGELREVLPEIEYTTIFRTKKLNMRNREADIAIRIGDPGDNEMIAQKVGAIKFGLFASDRYLARRGAPATVSELSRHDFIDLEGGANLPQIAETRRLIPDLKPGLTVDCILLQAHSTAQGLGFAPLPTYMAATYPELVEILPGALTSERDVWVLTHPDAGGSACVRATLKHLILATQTALTA